MYKPDEALKQSIDQWIEANQNDFVRDLAKLVAIPSISVENDGPWPFGEECKNVLDKATEIAGGYGFIISQWSSYPGVSGTMSIMGISSQASKPSSSHASSKASSCG